MTFFEWFALFFRDRSSAPCVLKILGSTATISKMFWSDRKDCGSSSRKIWSHSGIWVHKKSLSFSMGQATPFVIFFIGFFGDSSRRSRIWIRVVWQYPLRKFYFQKLSGDLNNQEATEVGLENTQGVKVTKGSVFQLFQPRQSVEIQGQFIPTPLLFFHQILYIFSFLQDYNKIFSKTRYPLLKICPYFINYKNFLKIFSTIFKVLLKFFLKFPRIFSKTTLSLHFDKLYKFIEIC